MQFKKVAIIDDDPSARETFAEMLELSGFEPLLIEKPFTKVEELVWFIQQNNSEAVICDHRLSNHAFAPFKGSELMGELYNQKIPSILVTQYTETDINVSIRRYRDKIPVLLERDDLVDIDIFNETIPKGFEVCSQEFNGIMSSSRRGHRTLIDIVAINTDSGEEVAEVFVPSWNPYHAVRFPTSEIPEDLLTQVKLCIEQKQEACLFAYVNTGANKADELYFTRFETAPELNENDGLA
jgi:CheY-like chemotaxis protein